MAYAHHPHIFSHDWFQAHPQWRAKFKRYAPAVVLGAALASAAVLVWSIYAALDMPPMDAETMSTVVDEIFVPTGISSYLPSQF